MSKTFFKLAGGDFFQDWTNTGLITTSDDWSGVDSIVGYRGDGLASSGRDPRLVTADSTVIDVNANATNPNTNTTGGVTEFQIADPVVRTGAQPGAVPRRIRPPGPALLGRPARHRRQQ
jgi:hypothetical protein